MSVRVLPFAREVHAVAWSFAILRFAVTPELEAVCMPGITGAVFFDGEHDGSAYEAAFGKLQTAALDPGASVRLITSVAEDLFADAPKAQCGFKRQRPS